MKKITFELESNLKLMRLVFSYILMFYYKKKKKNRWDIRSCGIFIEGCVALRNTFEEFSHGTDIAEFI